MKWKWKRFPLRFPFFASFLISLAVGGAIIGIRQLGWLEAMELAAYDWVLSTRPRSPAMTSRIAIIAIDEEDIRRQGRWPLTDETLARVLQILTQYRPRAIGVDLFRDLPVPPGGPTLTKVLTDNRNIIVITKVGEPIDHTVPPPSFLKNTEQVGFADVVLDPGGVVRRGLLYLDDGETTVMSFDLRLALLYLRMEGIVPQPDLVNPQHLRLGRVTIPPFEADDGGYINVDARGYQFLLDFQDAGRPFPTFSLMNLLDGGIAPEAIRDKIVLIGVTTDSVKDTFFIPYRETSHSASIVPGVVLHAQIVNQLLREALDGNAPITTMGEQEEWGWTLLWCVMGGMVGLWSYLPLRFPLCRIGGLVILSASVYWAFLHSWWIPLIPPAAGWMVSTSLVRDIFFRQKRRPYEMG